MLVSAARTQPEHAARWWDPSGVPLAACEIARRPGGGFRFVHATYGGAGGEPAPASGDVFAGTYHAVAPPGQPVFTARAPSRANSVGAPVFAEGDGKTTLTITDATAADRAAMRHLGVDAGTARTPNHPGAYLAGIG